ncbi:MAG: hypothetical protein V4661_05145 [Pseudomonadota bacterium]
MPALVENLNEGADANGDEEGDDEERDGAPQGRLGYQQPVICRLGDRLSQSLD